MRIGIYARVSTNGEKQELANQLTPLREWASHLGGEVVEEYHDEASGCREDRVALKRLLENAHQGKFDILLIWALDRLSREGIAKMSGYLEKLKGCGVRVLSHQESWLDTSGPVSELLIAIFGWVAQQERNRIRERVLSGLRTAKSKGKKLGRPSRTIDLNKALKFKSQGFSIREIAQFLGVPRATLARFLSQNPPSIAT